MIKTAEYDPGVVKLPSWFKQEIPDMNKIRAMQDLFRGARLHTVCESAKCPNMGACWKQGVATFMILGGTCTRACRFCAVASGRGQPVDHKEPDHVALAVQQLGLRYVVVTSVTRDDLEDQGAMAFVKTIEAIRRLTSAVKIEVLIPDFSAKEDCLKLLSDAAPEVIAHNIETVRRMSPYVRPQALHDRSLQVLRRLRELKGNIFIKSSLMVGLGERDEEIVEVMSELREAGCQIVTIGQYLAPTTNDSPGLVPTTIDGRRHEGTTSKRHWPVERFVPLKDFERYRQIGMDMGFVHVESGPLVRSSYIAEKGYQAALSAMEVTI